MTLSEQKIADNSGHRQRMRERFAKSDGADMADYELLELLLMMAIPRRDVKPIAKELIRKFGSFAKVVNAPKDELQQIKWVKDNVYILLKTIAAAVKRVCHENLQDEQEISFLSDEALVEYCRATMAYAEIEELRVIYLDANLKMIGDELLQKGTLTSVSVFPREVVAHALSHNAAAIILVHNHPSDNVTPSVADQELTAKIYDACQLMDIKLQEHIIIGKTNYFSFVANGIMDNIRRNSAQRLGY